MVSGGAQSFSCITCADDGTLNNGIKNSVIKNTGTIFGKKLFPKIAPVFLIALFFIPLFSVPSSAQVMQENDCAPPLTTTIDANYQGPVAVDAYWLIKERRTRPQVIQSQSKRK